MENIQSKAPVILFCIGSKKMRDTGVVTAHGLGMAFAQHICRNFVETALYSIGTIEIAGEPILILINKTNANSAHEALASFITDYGLQVVPSKLVIVHDDLNVPAFKMVSSFKKQGDSGHIPVKSILDFVQSQEPPRIKFGPASSDLDVVYDTNLLREYSSAFNKAVEVLGNWITYIHNKSESHQALREATAQLELWVNLHSSALSLATAQLNNPFRLFKQPPPPAFVVMDSKTASNLRKAVLVLCSALQAQHKNVSGILSAFPQFPSHVVRDVLKRRLSLNYLNLDFHDGTNSTDVSLIECNSTMGAPSDSVLYENMAIQLGVEDELNIRSINSLLPAKGYEAIIEYCFRPHVTDGVVAIVNYIAGKHIGDEEGHCEVLHEMLLQKGISSVLCCAEELTYDNPANPTCVMCQGQKVDVIWVRASILKEEIRIPLEKNSVLLDPRTEYLCAIYPSFAMRIYTQKSYIPILYKGSNTAIASKAESIRKYITYSSLLTAENEYEVRHMVMSGIPIALKYILGGNSRASFMLTQGDSKWSSRVNAAVEASNSKLPAIVQGYAPKFDLVGTVYEYDVRALVFEETPSKLHIQFHARIYRKGNDKFQGDVPIFVTQDKEDKIISKKDCVCAACGLELPIKFLNQNCPKCKQGIVVNA